MRARGGRPPALDRLAGDAAAPGRGRDRRRRSDYAALEEVCARQATRSASSSTASRTRATSGAILRTARAAGVGGRGPSPGPAASGSPAVVGAASAGTALRPPRSPGCRTSSGRWSAPERGRAIGWSASFPEARTVALRPAICRPGSPLVVGGEGEGLRAAGPSDLRLRRSASRWRPASSRSTSRSRRRSRSTSSACAPGSHDRTRSSCRFVDSFRPRCYQSALRHDSGSCLVARPIGVAVRPRASHRGGFASMTDSNGAAGQRGAARRCSSGVEQLTCNQQVVGSTPTIGSRLRRQTAGCGEVPERPKGADCKSAGERLRRFESSPLHRDRYRRSTNMRRGSSSVGRARAFQARGRGFDSRLPLVASRHGRVPT